MSMRRSDGFIRHDTIRNRDVRHSTVRAATVPTAVLDSGDRELRPRRGTALAAHGATPAGRHAAASAVAADGAQLSAVHAAAVAAVRLDDQRPVRARAVAAYLAVGRPRDVGRPPIPKEKI